MSEEPTEQSSSEEPVEQDSPSTEANTETGDSSGPTGTTTGGKPVSETKMVSGILGIVLGTFGVHKFYLGYQTEGIIMLIMFLVGVVLAAVSCGILFFLPMIPWLIGLIEGILYLTKSDEEFAETYINNKKPWF